MYKLFKFYIDSNVDDISFAVFENYSYGSTGHLADLGELNGMYKLVLEENGIPFDTVAPSSAKKAITGNGRATKEEVAGALKNFIINIDSFVFADNDQTDSIAVGVTYALIMLNHLKKNNE
jgi:crossover junction endodeoxyribonuclease RuvC